tara:strand:- start:704 stop:1084 length:381 start_codon:yes stop_codon:yes gene_type:complete
MGWKKKRKVQGKNKYYSLSKKLRNEQRSNDEFEVTLSRLTLEEVIGLKLELASKTIGGRLFGMPIWYSLHTIVQDAVLKYVVSASRTHGEAARYLGLHEISYQKLRKKHNIDDYFSEISKKNDIDY